MSSKLGVSLWSLKELSITITADQLKFQVAFYYFQILDLHSGRSREDNFQPTKYIIVLNNRVVSAQRNCSLQWIPAYEDIFCLKQADNLAKTARNSPQLSDSLTLTDALALAIRKLLSHLF
ncbi:hypothetical protein TNCV_4012841 [Trichonephila clavipes]|nr:hypothetical protein TNCV_4012841 [Trichonephila clavipes]